MRDMIFLIYASRDGHTRQIIRRLASALSQKDHNVTVYNVEEREPPAFMLEEASTVVIVSPIRFGHHLKAIDRFIHKYKASIRDECLGLVSINLTARKPAKNAPETNPYYKKWLRRHQIVPAIQAVFGGKLDYGRCKWWEKQAIRLIMKITGGPTDPSTNKDYTNWALVDELAEEISDTSHRQQEAA